jgi:thiol-disulfide isomerase/thioredoxin
MAWAMLVLPVAFVLGGCVRSSAASAHGPAPELVGIQGWLNSPPQSIETLRGRVVLVEFWTRNCINCRHALEHTVRWHRRYKDRGLVVIGIHTPETEMETDVQGVQDALRDQGITYPVALDHGYATWDAYGNQFWPAYYLINRDGDVVRKHVGEGDYAATEAAIVELLEE